jgi:hypothetical protein
MQQRDSEVTVYSVYEPPGDEADLEARAEKVAFVKEGFNWVAFFLPVIWLIFQRMWIELVLFLVIIAAVPFFFGSSEAGREFAGWTTLALTVLFAFEANDLRGWALQRRGFRFAAVASGSNRVEAERSFFSRWLSGRARPVRRATAAPLPGMSHQESPPWRGTDDDVIGSFPRA